MLNYGIAYVIVITAIVIKIMLLKKSKSDTLNTNAYRRKWESQMLTKTNGDKNSKRWSVDDTNQIFIASKYIFEDWELKKYRWNTSWLGKILSHTFRRCKNLAQFITFTVIKNRRNRKVRDIMLQKLHASQ